MRKLKLCWSRWAHFYQTCCFQDYCGQLRECRFICSISAPYFPVHGLEKRCVAFWPVASVICIQPFGQDFYLWQFGSLFTGPWIFSFTKNHPENSAFECRLIFRFIWCTFIVILLFLFCENSYTAKILKTMPVWRYRKQWFLILKLFYYLIFNASLTI